MSDRGVAEGKDISVLLKGHLFSDRENFCHGETESQNFCSCTKGVKLEIHLNKAPFIEASKLTV